MRVAMPVARLRVRRLPLLQQRPRDALRVASSTPATASTAASPSTRSATRATSSRSPTAIDLARRRAADLRGRDDLQGGQGLRRGSSDLVAVFGVGGLGHLAIQYARITGATVVAVDINEERLRVARELGAEHIDQRRRAGSRRGDPARSAAPTWRSPPPSPRSRSSRPSARWRAAARSCCVGLPADNDMHLPIFETVLGGLTIKGSIVGTHHDLEEVFALHAGRAHARALRDAPRWRRSTRRSRRSRTGARGPRVSCSSSDW